MKTIKLDGISCSSSGIRVTPEDFPIELVLGNSRQADGKDMRYAVLRHQSLGISLEGHDDLFAKVNPIKDNWISLENLFWQVFTAYFATHPSEMLSLLLGIYEDGKRDGAGDARRKIREALGFLSTTLME